MTITDIFISSFSSSYLSFLGYYLTTLEASTQHISDLADNFENTHRSNHLFDDGDDMYHDAHFDLNDLTRS